MENGMEEFPEFMRNPANAVAGQEQSPGVQGYVYDGADGTQMAFWTCLESGVSAEHTHPYDEYFVVLQGEYVLILGQGRERVTLRAGGEYHIPAGVPHGGEFQAGTRTIHAFGGFRAHRQTAGTA